MNEAGILYSLNKLVTSSQPIFTAKLNIPISGYPISGFEFKYPVLTLDPSSQCWTLSESSILSRIHIPGSGPGSGHLVLNQDLGSRSLNRIPSFGPEFGYSKLFGFLFRVYEPEDKYPIMDMDPDTQFCIQSRVRIRVLDFGPTNSKSRPRYPILEPNILCRTRIQVSSNRLKSVKKRIPCFKNFGCQQHWDGYDMHSTAERFRF